MLLASEVSDYDKVNRACSLSYEEAQRVSEQWPFLAQMVIHQLQKDEAQAQKIEEQEQQDVALYHNSGAY